MAVFSMQDISVSFGGPSLLEKSDLQIEKGERVCIVGRNGAGKSTLIRLIAGEISPDAGQVVRPQGARITMLTQEVPQDLSGTVFDLVAGGLEGSELLAAYHRVGMQLATEGPEGSDKLLEELERIHHALEISGGWSVQQRVETVLSHLGLPADVDFTMLSGGLKRRVLLARALVCEPDLLLLDEPTNHLDITSINWLEEFLLDFGGALIFVTHDRMLLQRLATRIIELDRGRLTSWPGNYTTYLDRKQAALEAEAGQQARFDKKLAKEEAWVRQGIKARRTRNEGRVRALKEMREERKGRRAITGQVRMQIQEAERTGKLVIEAEGVSYRYADKPVICDFSTTIIRGDRVGIIGPNGSGKTTLLRLLLGDLPAQQGLIRHGTRMEIAYFDQHRTQLDEEKSVLDNVAEGTEYVTINGNQRHVMGYLQDFLFSPERARTPVKVLSGGERNRLLLARLFTKPSNVLVLDEPTNDLDAETLDLLEELLLDYQGTLLLVSHDRAFLNNVVTSTLVFEEEGRVNEYVGGYDDWLRWRTACAVEAKAAAKPEKGEIKNQVQERPRKLSYKEQRELEFLPLRIEALESEQKLLHEAMSDPAFYQKGTGEVSRATSRLEALELELTEVYRRWEELDALL